jgi:hypothetical protein
VVIELRLDGTMAIRFQGQYLRYQEVATGSPGGLCPPDPPEFSALAADATEAEAGQASGPEARPRGLQPTAGRSGRTPAEPYPPDGDGESSRKGPWRPAAHHPWRRSSRACDDSLMTADIPTLANQRTFLLGRDTWQKTACNDPNAPLDSISSAARSGIAADASFVTVAGMMCLPAMPVPWNSRMQRGRLP